MTPVLRVATVGNPNVGKSSLINAIAGSNLSVGNWPGTTVDRLSISFELDQVHVEWVDLPGTYSLAGATSEESITRRELLTSPPDVVVNVIDAGNLERNLGLTLELSELGLPMVVVLNLVDEARAHGIEVDASKLSDCLGVEAIETVASSGQGCAEVKAALLRASRGRALVEYPEYFQAAVRQLDEPNRWRAVTLLSEDVPGLDSHEQAQRLRRQLELVQDPFLSVAEARLKMARHLTCDVEVRIDRGVSRTEKIDRLLLHPLLGLPLFLVGMLEVFRFTYEFSAPWIGFLDVVKGVLSSWVTSWGLAPLAQSFLISGVIGGAGTVAAFSPVLFLLYLAMAFLEASGLLARTTFLFDQVMKWVGLPGRSLIPLLLGFGCNVPAIYSTRILPNLGDRLRVALAIPFMACSARLTVFVLFAAIFFPKTAPYVVLGLYLLGLLLGLLTALLMRRFVPQDSDRTGIMEMPPYRFPSWRAVFRQAWLRTYSFLRDAAGPILGAVLLVWFLHQVPAGKPENSLYAGVSRALTVPLAPLGIHDWRLAGALMPGFIAKEVVVGTLGVSFLGEEPVAAGGLGEGLGQLATGFGVALQETVLAVPKLFGVPSAELPPDESPNGLSAAIGRACDSAGALAYLVFLLLYTPCVATVAAVRSEFGNGWAIFSVIWQLSVAWLAGWIAYQVMA
ncbi:MAG: ferrous iron transport protein B [Candidatus Eremiobacteraeota bacterium]|nr:ferrous iron transport protein B [Candidatus Eremiobacteraeota bacterium]MCW5869911.1 ferrous iron transport protein B [Candidatus Eremiobacteraeota bacterium]